MSNRRDFLKGLAALGLATGTAGLLTPKAAAAAPAGKALRVAHFTDIHLDDTAVARKGLAHCLKAAQEAGAVAILNTGDSFRKLDGSTLAAVEPQWRAWREATKDCPLPMHSCLGNHDLWTPPKSDEPNHTGHAGLARGGRAESMRLLGMPAQWHAARIGGWKFLMCDSTAGGSYAFGAEQMAWIERELSSLGEGEHAALCCHVPIQSVGAWMWMVNRSPREKWTFPRGDLQVDLRDVTDLLRRFPRAKAVLSGHVHYVDAVDYLGVTHLNSGAVSGNWWKGDGVLDRDFPPAFGLVDFHPDGRVERRMVGYTL